MIMYNSLKDFFHAKEQVVLHIYHIVSEEHYYGVIANFTEMPLLSDYLLGFYMIPEYALTDEIINPKDFPIRYFRLNEIYLEQERRTK